MNPKEILTDFTWPALRSGRSFALWFLPGNDNINAILQSTTPVSILNHPDERESYKGFIFYPFQINRNNQAMLLHPDVFLQGMAEIKNFSGHTERQSNVRQTANQSYRSTSKDEYLQTCNQLISSIRRGEAKKVVLSRIKILRQKKDRQLSEIFLSLKEKYPTAFCYLFYTPQSGIWMGASPEIFLSKNGNIIRTMALAGTRKSNPEKPGEQPWPEKERREQQVVTDFIKSELEKSSPGSFRFSSPYTLQAGSIEHICTDFVIDTEKSAKTPWQLIDSLHPTPAVCGYPKAAALQIINRTEKHNREYYTGFLGPVNLRNRTDLFVNLRCMKIDGGKIILFIGGGITAESDAESEWMETEMKAGILESVLDHD
jgi:isochorismate synthase